MRTRGDAEAGSVAQTFLFTDIVGSTVLWELAADEMRVAMVRHDQIVDDAASDHHGRVVRPRGEGDSRFLVFDDAAAAVAAAASLCRRLGAEPWQVPTPIRVRAAVHTGQAEFRDGDFYGRDVNRCARLRSAGHPEQILVSEVTAACVETLPDGLRLRDLGRHRLRDLSDDERIFQLCGWGGPDALPPLRTSNRMISLPHPVDALFGRDEVIESVATAVHRGVPVTLTGLQGVGTSTVAVAAAWRVLDDFPGGAVHCDVRSSRDLTSMVRSAFGLDAVSWSAVVEAIAGPVRNRPTILVLDHVDDSGASSDLVGSLTAIDGLAVITTSCGPLGLPEESVIPVHPLDGPASPTVEAIRACDAGALLLSRFEANGGVVGPAEVADMSDLLLRLAGIPSELVAAAGLLGEMPPSRIATAANGAGSAVVEDAFESLEDELRDVLRVLATFPGPPSVALLEELCVRLLGRAPGAALTSLVSRGLVVRETVGTSTRLRLTRRLHEHVRSTDPDRGWFDKEMVELLLEQSTAEVEELLSTADAAGSEWLCAHVDLLVGAVDALRATDEHETVAHLVIAVAPYLMSQRRFGDAADLLASLDPRPGDRDTELRAVIQTQTAGVAYLRADWPTCEEAARAAASGYRDIGDHEREAGVLRTMAVARLATGDADGAEQISNEILRLIGDHEHPRIVSEGLLLAGVVAAERGDTRRAVDLLEEAVALADVAASASTRLYGLVNLLAIATLGSDDFDVDRRLRAVTEAMTDEVDSILAMELRSVVAAANLRLGRVRDAIGDARVLVDVIQSSGSVDDAQAAVLVTGAVLAECGDPTIAATLLSSAMRIYDRVDSRARSPERVLCERSRRLLASRASTERLARAERMGAYLTVVEALELAQVSLLAHDPGDPTGDDS